MDNKTLIVGLVAGAVLIGVGFLVYAATMAPQSVPAAQTPAATDTSGNPPVSQKPQASVPVATTDSNDVFVSNATALVTGKVTPNGAPTSYWYDYGTTEALGTRTTLQAVGSGWVQIPAPAYITGLSANTRYFFRLSAQNSYGTVTGATYSLMTNSTPAPRGAAPSGSTDDATDVARTAATVNGHVNPNGWSTSYWFEYGENTSFGNTTALQGAGSGTNSLPASTQLSNLKPLTKYYFRLNAQNPYGTVNGTVHSFTTLGPASPSAPSASATSASAVATSSATLNGKVNPDGDQTTYWFEYSRDSLLGNILGATTHTQIAGSGTSLVDVAVPVTGLTRNTHYYFRVVAQNAYGTTRSSIASFTTRR